MNKVTQSLWELKRYSVLLLLTVLMAMVYHSLTERAYVKLRIDTSATTELKLYWSGENHEYWDQFSSNITIFPGKEFYTIPFTDLKNVRTFRLDPTNESGVKIKIRDVSIFQDGYKPIRLHHQKALSQFKPIRDITNFAIDRSGLSFTSSGIDSILEFEPVYEKVPASYLTHLWRFSLLFLVLFIIWRHYDRIIHQTLFVPVAMLVALTMISTMASTSRLNAHPDETVHVAGAVYYKHHFKPPEICAPNTLASYSPYGASRLNTNELAYFFAGKFIKLTNLLPLENYKKARFFNVSLFLILMVLAALNPIFRWLCLPLIASPQVWYLFSYFNSEAFAIFISIILGHQVVAPHSAFKKLIGGEYKIGRAILMFIALAFLASMFFFIKRSFYFFTLFIFICGFAWWWLEGRKPEYKKVSQRALGVLVAAVMLFGGWALFQQSINNFDHAQKIIDCKEQTARFEYKPSTPPDDTAWSIHWKEKGHGIDLIFHFNWFEKVFRSAFGYYGYFSTPASEPLYDAFRVLFAALVFYLFLFGFIKGSALQRSILGIALLVISALISTAIWKAWISDFQPQGRYLFAIVPILGVLFSLLYKRLNPKILSVIVLMMFVLGVFSFMSIGILEIPRG